MQCHASGACGEGAGKSCWHGDCGGADAESVGTWDGAGAGIMAEVGAAGGVGACAREEASTEAGAEVAFCAWTGCAAARNSKAAVIAAPQASRVTGCIPRGIGRYDT